MGGSVSVVGAVVAFRPQDERHATLAHAEAKRIGYSRDRDAGRLARMLDRRRCAGCSQVFSDSVSGSASFRPGLEAALASLSPGDLVAVDSLAQLAWREDELRQILARVHQAGAHVIAEAEAFDTRHPASVFDTLRCLSAFAVNVRAARMAEAHVGRPDRRAKITDEGWDEVEAALSDGRLSVAKAAEALGVRRSTVYRRLAG